MIYELVQRKERIRQAKERAKARKKRHDVMVGEYRQRVFVEGDDKYGVALELAGRLNVKSVE